LLFYCVFICESLIIYLDTQLGQWELLQKAPVSSARVPSSVWAVFYSSLHHMPPVPPCTFPGMAPRLPLLHGKWFPSLICTPDVVVLWEVFAKRLKIPSSAPLDPTALSQMFQAQVKKHRMKK
jgi:hypothetical protein